MTDRMHTEEHLDLIDALVEGRSSDQATARHLVATCPECGEAYRAHLVVKQAVESQTVVPLSEVERRRLHAAVWSELEVSAEFKRTTPLWYRVAPMAAALVLVVGVGSILLGGNGGTETSGTTLATASAQMDSYAAQAESSDRSLSGAGKSDAGGATATTSSPTEETSAMAGPSTTAAATATTATPLRLTVDELAQAAAQFALRAQPVDLDPDLERCLAQDALAPSDPFAEENIVVADQPGWLVAFGSEGEVSAVVVYGVDDCAVFFRDLG